MFASLATLARSQLYIISREISIEHPSVWGSLRSPNYNNWRASEARETLSGKSVHSIENRGYYNKVRANFVLITRKEGGA